MQGWDVPERPHRVCAWRVSSGGLRVHQLLADQKELPDPSRRLGQTQGEAAGRLTDCPIPCSQYPRLQCMQFRFSIQQCMRGQPCQWVCALQRLRPWGLPGSTMSRPEQCHAADEAQAQERAEDKFQVFDTIACDCPAIPYSEHKPPTHCHIPCNQITLCKLHTASSEFKNAQGQQAHLPQPLPVR